MAFAWIWVFGGKTPLASLVMMDLGRLRSCGGASTRLDRTRMALRGAYLYGHGILAISTAFLDLPLRCRVSRGRRSLLRGRRVGRILLSQCRPDGSREFGLTRLARVALAAGHDVLPG